MKALRIRITKDFLNRKVGDVIQIRRDLGEDLIRQGLGEWVTIELKNEFEEPVVEKAVVIEPEIKIYEPEIHNDDLAVPVKKRNRKPKPTENK